MEVAANTIVIIFVYPSQDIKIGINANEGRFCNRSKTGIIKSPNLVLLTGIAINIAKVRDIK
jgi:hypothetical protein